MVPWFNGKAWAIPAASAKPATPNSSTQSCDQCGVIVAIVQRVIDTGSPYVSDGYFVYDLHIRMEKTGLLRTVTVGTEGALVEGQRVKVSGGTVEPVT